MSWFSIARMHSRKKGKSGSTRPARLEKPSWLTISSSEVEDFVIKLARKGNSKSMIGTILRDSFGVPLVKIVTGKKINQILEEAKIEEDLPEDLRNLAKKAVNLRKHLETNKKDLDSRKGLHRIESKIYRLIKYYKKKGVISQEFKYTPEEIKTLLI